MYRTFEVTDYIGADGVLYPLHVPAAIGRWVISSSGWGAPPVDFVTQRGPYQHGETVVDFFLRPRVIQLLIRQQFCDRDGYWSGRAALLDGIRPNRQIPPTGTAPGTLRRQLSDGSYRSIDCYLQEGPRFEPRQLGQWDSFAFQEVLRFVAYNPVIYDPGGHTEVFAIDEELVFPITFPIVFGSLNAVADITYPGTWLEYPTITITGPISSPGITNETTGETIALDYDVASGEVVTITLAYGTKTVVNGAGTNLIGSVTPESDLGTFHLAPAPEAPLGVNTIRVTGTGVSAFTAVTVSWFDRYFGV